MATKLFIALNYILIEGGSEGKSKTTIDENTEKTLGVVSLFYFCSDIFLRGFDFSPSTLIAPSSRDGPEV